MTQVDVTEQENQELSLKKEMQEVKDTEFELMREREALANERNDAQAQHDGLALINVKMRNELDFLMKQDENLSKKIMRRNIDFGAKVTLHKLKTLQSIPENVMASFISFQNE